LNALPFYQTQGAKSLGRETLEETFIPLIDQSVLSPMDILRTLVEHFAYQIATVIQAHQASLCPSVLLTGGGAYHRFFVERLDQRLEGKWQQITASQELIEFKEALIFAFLGVLKLRGERNTLASVTGAYRDSCGGVCYG
jgi:anhydro-N-acetylmuramic acid kinase